MEQHENAALVAALVAWSLGLISLLAVFLSRRSRLMPHWFASASLMVGIAAAGLMAWTANVGVQMRHTQIRGASSATSALATRRSPADE